MRVEPVVDLRQVLGQRGLERRRAPSAPPRAAAASALSITMPSGWPRLAPVTHAGLDRAVHHQPVLDRRRRHVLALAGLEQLLDPAGDAQVALGIERALVAGVQPAVGGERFARSAPAPCSSRASRPGSCTWISPLAGSMRDSTPSYGRPTVPGRCDAGQRGVRDAAVLGHAVDLDRSQAEARVPAQQLGRHRRGAAGGEGAVVAGRARAGSSCARCRATIGMPQQPLQLRRRHLGVHALLELDPQARHREERRSAARAAGRR